MSKSVRNFNRARWRAWNYVTRKKFMWRLFKFYDPRDLVEGTVVTFDDVENRM